MDAQGTGVYEAVSQESRSEVSTLLLMLFYLYRHP